MSKGGKTIVWGLVIGFLINAFVFYLLIFAGGNSQTDIDRGWLVFLTVPLLGLWGIILILSGMMPIWRDENQ